MWLWKNFHCRSLPNRLSQQNFKEKQGYVLKKFWSLEWDWRSRLIPSFLNLELFQSRKVGLNEHILGINTYKLFKRNLKFGSDSKRATLQNSVIWNFVEWASKILKQKCGPFLRTLMLSILTTLRNMESPAAALLKSQFVLRPVGGQSALLRHPVLPGAPGQPDREGDGRHQA